MDGLLCGPDPLCSLESKAAAVEGASHDLVDYLKRPELHSYGSSQNCPRRVPGRQPVPGPEKMQNSSAWQWALKLAKPSPTRLENLKNILTSLKISWKLSSSNLKVKPVPPTLPFVVPQTEEHPGAKLWL